ncbi:dTDP-4-dehydrorhamnose reductase [Gammaproteobacteria bacterium]
MRYLISGSGGQLATEIIRLLRERSVEFEALKKAEFDITSQAKVSAVMQACRPDVVINCAAYNAVDEAEDQWRQAYMINGVGVRNLANESRKLGCVLVHFSTDYVFDGAKASPYTIVDRPAPENRYGESKLLGERYVRDLMERFFLVRLSWVFGKGEFSFPRKVLQWAAKSDKLRIVDDQVSSPAYAEHLAGAVLDLIGTGAFGLYHMTNKGHCTRYKWAEHILRKIGWQGELLPAKSAEFNTQAKRPPFSALENFPLEETLGYALPSWQEATEEFLRVER